MTRIDEALSIIRRGAEEILIEEELINKAINQSTMTDAQPDQWTHNPQPSTPNNDGASTWVSIERGPSRPLNFKEAKKLYKHAFNELVNSASDDDTPMCVIAQHLKNHEINDEWDKFELLEAILADETAPSMLDAITLITRTLEFNSCDMRKVIQGLLDEHEGLIKRETRIQCQLGQEH